MSRAFLREDLGGSFECPGIQWASAFFCKEKRQRDSVILLTERSFAQRSADAGRLFRRKFRFSPERDARGSRWTSRGASKSEAFPLFNHRHGCRPAAICLPAALSDASARSKEMADRSMPCYQSRPYTNQSCFKKNRRAVLVTDCYSHYNELRFSFPTKTTHSNCGPPSANTWATTRI